MDSEDNYTDIQHDYCRWKDTTTAWPFRGKTWLDPQVVSWNSSLIDKV